MITDPWFYAAAFPAVVLIGFGKGGFAGLGTLAVPLMAMVAPPLQVAAIMLPILLVMDAIAVWTYRRQYDRRTLIITLPASLIGIGLAWLIAARVEPDHIRLLIGVIGIAFTLNHWIRKEPPGGSGHSVARGTFWGAMAGFTSFVTLTGAPPYQMYVLPLKLDHRVYAGTFVIFFAVTNILKVVPFFMLGQMSPTNLGTSAALLPLAVVSVFVGIRLVRRVSPSLFYRLVYVVLFAISLKLLWDGGSAVLAGS